LDSVIKSEIADTSEPLGSSRKHKTPKLARYEAVAARLLADYDANRVFVDISGDTPWESSPAVLDLFAGAGGISLGFSKAGYQVLCAVELVEVAAETHKHNFPDSKVFCGDIGDFEPSEHLAEEKVDVVIGGPPCQGFSVAGKRDPNDPRNRLFEQFVRVVRDTQPDYFVMENVPGILTMSNGKVKDAILEAFEEAGYPHVSIAILEAAHYGVAQIRSRAIFIGNRHGLPNPFPAPLVTPDNFTPIESAIGDLPAWERNPEINHEWTQHSKKFTERISLVEAGESLYETFADAYKRQYRGVPSMTVKENHGGTHIHPDLDRCISAREMARLQSFPDSFYFTGGMKKAMWQIGNAVPPRLAEVIALALKPFLESLETKQAPRFDRVVLPNEAIQPPSTLF
jgi:DNA (cytosine-5)-methyltransferase 1